MVRTFHANMEKFDEYKKILDACGHDTQDLVACMARTRAAIQELQHVNEFMTAKFNENPFPYLTSTDAQAPDKHVPTKDEFAAQQEMREQLAAPSST